MTPIPSDHLSDEQLSAFLEGELGPVESEGLAGHVAGCEQCRKAVEELRRNRAILSGLPRKLAPASFTRRVQGRIRRRSRGRFFRHGGLGSYRITYLVAAIVLVLLAALYFFSLSGPELRDGTTGLSADQLWQQREGTGGSRPGEGSGTGRPEASDPDLPPLGPSD